MSKEGRLSVPMLSFWMPKLCLKQIDNVEEQLLNCCLAIICIKNAFDLHQMLDFPLSFFTYLQVISASYCSYRWWMR